TSRVDALTSTTSKSELARSAAAIAARTSSDSATTATRVIAERPSRSATRRRTHDEFSCDPCWNCHAEPADDHAVDADQSSVRVDERTSGVPWCQTYVGHDEPRFACARMRRDAMNCAHRQRVTHTERMAMSENYFPRAKGVYIAELERRATYRG